jgi:hypothetical protein
MAGLYRSFAAMHLKHPRRRLDVDVPRSRLFPGTIAYVWHGALHAATMAHSLEQAFRLGHRLSGRRSALLSGGATITGSMSVAGTRCAPKEIGPAIRSRQRSGAFPAGIRMRRQFTVYDKRSSAHLKCAEFCSFCSGKSQHHIGCVCQKFQSHSAASAH